LIPVCARRICIRRRGNPSVHDRTKRKAMMNLPNQLSLLRILLTPVFVLLLFLDRMSCTVLSFVVFTVASITDYYDGYAARKYNIITMWGQFLDPMADKILVSSALICFNNLGYVSAWMVLVIVVRDFIITGLRSYAILKGKPIVTSRFAKVKTYFQFVVLYYIFLQHLLVSFQLTGSAGAFVRRMTELNLIYPLALSITILTVVTGVMYLIGNRSHLRMIVGSIYRIFAPSDV
jgi:CDP-diacylglycerol---glycerol-3-phosphate 3-phosphatidyltransferase